MNKELEKIVRAAESIALPDVREYQKGIEDAQQAQEAAQEAKETAETEKLFDLACDQAIRAREKEQFFRRRLNEVVYTPRMDQTEYDRYIRTADSVITTAADKCLDIIEKAVKDIVKARKEFMDLCAEADEALEKLDNAANVLQVEHRYRVLHFHNAPDVQKEDPDEWRHYTVRYGNGEGFKRLCQSPEGKAGWRCAEIMDGREKVYQTY